MTLYPVIEDLWLNFVSQKLTAVGLDKYLEQGASSEQQTDEGKIVVLFVGR